MHAFGALSAEVDQFVVLAHNVQYIA
jgi:hypothetical protein